MYLKLKIKNSVIHKPEKIILPTRKKTIYRQYIAAGGKYNSPIQNSRMNQQVQKNTLYVGKHQPFCMYMCMYMFIHRFLINLGLKM